MRFKVDSWTFWNVTVVTIRWWGWTLQPTPRNTAQNVILRPWLLEKNSLNIMMHTL